MKMNFHLKRLILVMFLFLLIFACSKNIEKEIKEEPPTIKVDQLPEPKIPEKVEVKEEKIEKTIKEAPAGYPKSIYPKTSEELERIKLKIQKLLSNNCEYTKRVVNGKEELYTPVFFEVNNFGFLDSAQCQQPVDKGKSSKSVEQAARDKLKEYANFLGTSQAEIEFGESREAYDSFIISTKNQKHKEIPVIKLENKRATEPKITLFLSRSDVLKDIGGHFYPEINIPITPQITVEQANNNLVDKDISFSDDAGIFIKKNVKKKDLSDQGELVILVLKNKDRLEYRLVWAIPISKKNWMGYVDALTGEVLEITQEFFT